jgi:hypothetical protein
MASAFTPSWTCPRPGHCHGERICQEIAPCTGERWGADTTADHDRTRAELDRLGIQHNLTPKAEGG